MIARLSILTAAAALCVGLGAPAWSAPAPTGATADAPATRPAGLQLAQSRGVDVFYDARGRRILVDSQTGEVVAVESPGRPGRWEERGVYRNDRLRDSGVLSAAPRGLALPGGEPGVVERYRRFREEQLGMREPLDWEYRQPRGGYADPRDAWYGDDPYADDPYAGEAPSWGGGDHGIRRDRGIERRALPLPGGQDFARGVPAERQALPGYDGNATGSTPRTPDPLAPPPPPRSAAAEDVARLQVLLDRAGVSPGVIDGKMGSNVQKALAALAEMTGEVLDPTDRARIDAALAETGGPAFMTYELTPEDVAGPYVASVPEDYGQKARLDRLSYTSTSEMLAERFHMDEAYLKALNPSVDFNRPGMLVKVADPGKPKTASVNRIVADKGRKQVRAYDIDGNLVAAYPATIGSSDTPSPTGTVKVERIAFDPEYTYNPKINFKQGNNDKVLRIPPGPNGPVGTIWIALSKPTYGIHGTPEPSRIGKSYSHGCVRLTNWDAAELARMVKPGIFVQFIE
jgi:lipoprotein-anchoring transpeptidase ErfK/SrfK